MVDIYAEVEEYDPFEDEIEEQSPEDELRERVQSVITKGMERAINHYEEHLEPIQQEATDYYHGRPFGGEQEGRSKVVITEVRDATLAQLPSLLRIFLGAESPVEYRPHGEEDAAIAEQMTDYIRYVISEDNPGFMVFWSWFLDALVRKLGVVKWFWDEVYRVEAAEYRGLDDSGVLVLQNDPSVEDVQITATFIDELGTQRYNVTASRRKKFGCPKIVCVPPEEFVFTPNSRDIDEAPLVAHVREVPKDELIAMGIDRELIEQAVGKDKQATNVGLRDARTYHEGADRWENEEEDRDTSQRPVLYAEVYARVDADGDDIAELRLFQCVGASFEITNGDGLGEIVDEVPFAVLTPYPEPHEIVGLGNFDLLKDVQLVKSQTFRGMLDSLAAAIDPMLEVVDGQVNLGDVLSPEPNRVVRVRQPGMMREVTHRFVGPDVLPVLAYMDELRENRTGTTKAAAGLDADSLQSATKAAVAATLSGAQQRVEMIARIFAETGVKRLFKGLLRLVVKNQDAPRVVRLRGQFVPIDPRAWDATMDVQVNVALGAGTTEDRINLLISTLAKQEEHLLNGSPLVSFQEIRHTLGTLLEIGGYRNTEKFFKRWGAEEQQAFEQQQAAQPPRMSPEEQLVEIERQRLRLEQQVEETKLELERMKIQLQDDRERDKIAREAVLKKYELELKHQADIQEAKLKAEIAADRQAQAVQEKSSE